MYILCQLKAGQTESKVSITLILTVEKFILSSGDRT